MLLIRSTRTVLSVWRWSLRAAGFSSSSESGPVSPLKEPQGKEVQVAVSSLRVDAVAAAGLDLSRKHIWEAVMDEMVMLNGKVLKKKSTSVHEGDVVEVDSVFKQTKERKSEANINDEESQQASAGSREAGDGGEAGDAGGEVTVRRGRVVVKEIGEQTRKGGYRLTLVRYKHFALFQRRLLHSLLLHPLIKS